MGRSRGLVVLAVLAVVGCGGHADSVTEDAELGSAPSPDVETIVEEIAAPPERPAESPPPDVAPLPETLDELIGRWAVLTRVSVIQEVDAPGMSAHRALTLSFAVADIERIGDEVLLEETYCHVEVQAEFGGAAPIIPAAWTLSMKPFVGRLTGAASEGGWAREEVVQIVGAILADPGLDTLPSSGTDPRVVDQDGDGHPGVTAPLMGIGDMYLARRERYRFVGMVPIAPDRLLGVMDDTSEQATLGASTWALNLPVTITPDPDPGSSTVELVRIPAGTDCDGLVAARGALFPND